MFFTYDVIDICQKFVTQTKDNTKHLVIVQKKHPLFPLWGLGGLKSNILNNPLHKLSSQEQQVLLHLIKGLTSGQVATLMGLQVDTVRTYRKRLYAKLKVNNIVALINLCHAHQEGH